MKDTNLKKKKAFEVVHYTDAYVVKEVGTDKIKAIRTRKAEANAVAKTLNATLTSKQWNNRMIFFISFCIEFDKITGRKYPKPNWYKKHRIQPTEKWKEEMPKFYKWFCNKKFEGRATYEEIIIKYFSKRKAN